MGQQYLTDTNAVIDFFNGRLPAKGKNFVSAQLPAISVITLIELLSNKNIPTPEWDQIQTFIGIALIYPMDRQVAGLTIALRQNH